LLDIHPPVIGSPTSNDRVEPGDNRHPRLSRATCAAHRRAFIRIRLTASGLGLINKLAAFVPASVTADVESEEVEALFEVDDPRLGPR